MSADQKGNTSADIRSRKLAQDEQNAARAIEWTRAVCVSVSAASPSDISRVFEKVIDEIAQKRSAIATLLASRERRVAIRY